MTKQTTLVLGASPKKERYSHKAATMLQEYGYSVELFGRSSGFIGGNVINTDIQQIDLSKIHTVTLYLSPKNQLPFIDIILKMKPQRVIFNPGTEHPEFYSHLSEQGVFYEEACTLVLLSSGQYESATQ